MRVGDVELSPHHSVREIFSAARAVVGEQYLRDLGRLEMIWRSTGAGPTYLLATCHGQPVGLAPVYFVRDHYAGWRPTDLFTGATEAGRWRRGVLVGSDATAPNALAGWHRAAVSAALTLGAVKLARGYRPDYFCLPHLDDDRYEAVRQALPGEPSAVGERTEAVLDLSFRSFDEYAGQLPSRRTAIRRERRRFLAAGVPVREVPLGDVIPELAAVLEQVDRKYGGPAASRAETTRYLTGLALAMRESGRALVVRDGDHLVAGSVLWDLGDEWRVRLWACDYDHPSVRRDYLYFNLMYYEPMLRAGAAGARRLLLGTGSLATKLLRGCREHRLRSLAWRGVPAGAPAVDG